MLSRLLAIPDTLGAILDCLDQRDCMSPRQLCNDLLHDFAVGEGLGQRPHIFEIPRRKACHLREVVLQVRRKSVDDLGAPSSAVLPVQDVAADFLV